MWVPQASRHRSYRMFFVVEGDTVKIGGFGAHPGFYRKLARGKELVREV